MTSAPRAHPSPATLLLAALAGGCADDAASPACDGMAPFALGLALGLDGDLTWRAVEDGAVLAFERGPQGGRHLALAARVPDAQDIATVRVVLHDVGADLDVSDVTAAGLPVVLEGCAAALPSIYAVFDEEVLPLADGQDPDDYLDGRDVDVTAELVDGDASPTATTARVTLAAP